MEAEIQVILDQNKRMAERMDNLTNQIDRDRSDIDQLKIDQDAIKKGQGAILAQLVDFKAEIRQVVQDEIRVQVSKAVSKELNKISLANPKKVFVTPFSIKNLFKFKHERPTQK